MPFPKAEPMEIRQIPPANGIRKFRIAHQLDRVAGKSLMIRRSRNQRCGTSDLYQTVSLRAAREDAEKTSIAELFTKPMRLFVGPRKSSW